MNTIKKMDIAYRLRTVIEVIVFALAIWGIAEGAGLVFWSSCIAVSLLVVNYSIAFLIRYVFFPDLSREIDRLGKAMVDDMTPEQ
ncbi:hypothetical protein [Salinibacter ruber]|uniref:Uncharacterized protein n=1 Tax=Salinibacter ruber TaxID=146919 RepID=A0AAW5P7J0_9BACT|nr:hypothetical protein [Salinibacter ruber]MCS4157806.1 hypothetical protein [Salinibacter ruber]